MLANLDVRNLIEYTLIWTAVGLGLPGGLIVMFYGVKGILYALMMMFTHDLSYEAKIERTNPPIRWGIWMGFFSGLLIFLSAFFR